MIPSFNNFPFPWIALDATDSTNHYLCQLCNERPDTEELTTVSAEYQTAGKGQRGNSWEAEAGSNLLFSFVLYPEFLDARRQFVLSQLVSLSVCEVLTQHTEGISIKWPNDIYWREKKICGILIENELSGHSIARCICGIGLNVNQTTFRSDAPNPVSLKQITGLEHDRYALLAELLRRVQHYYTRLRNEANGDFPAGLADRYARNLFRRQGFHAYEDAAGRFRARLLCVEPDGRFVLEDEAGQRREYLFKEVQYLP